MGFKNNTEIVLHELNTVLDKIDSAVINQVIEIINGSDKVFLQHWAGQASWENHSLCV